MSIKSITIIAALAFGLAAPAAAANYEFQYTSNLGNLFTGSFSGDATGNLVTNITNVAVSMNGTAFSGTVSAYGFFGYNGPGGPNSSAPTDYVLNAATVSFDPLLNNFLFTNSFGEATDDQFYIFPWSNGGTNQVATQAWLNGANINWYNGDYLPQNWSLSEIEAASPGGIPEPSTWFMLVIGFGLLGAVARRRAATVTA